MSDKQISVGDLVEVVRPVEGCGCTHNLGMIFRVTEIYTHPFGSCRSCGFEVDLPITGAGGGPYAINIRRLKRIPPLDELDDVKRDAEITA